MKANELRIGNYMNYRFYNPLPNNPTWETQKVTIVGILKTQLYFKYDNDNSVNKIKELEPIPLTEEWLLKFGFEKKENSLFTKKLEYIYNSLKYSDDYKIWIYYNDDNDAACNAIADLNFVHQLQNLYFALTNEELTMK